MGAYITFWLAKMFAEALPGLIFLALFLLFTAWDTMGDAIAQSRCKHTRLRETQACQLVCRDCGKDLGFIGTYIEEHRGEKLDIKFN